MSQLPPWSEPPPSMPGVRVARPRTADSTRVPARPDLERPASGWRWWEAVLVYIGAAVAGIIVATPFAGVGDRGTGLMVVNAVFALVQLAVLVLWLRRAHPEWVRAIGFPTRRRLPKELIVGLASGIGLFLAITFGVGIALSLLFALITGSTVRAPQQLPSDLSTTGRVLAGVYAVGVAPAAEEFFFRGCLFRSLRDRLGFWLAALGSALAFGLVHYVPSTAARALLLMTVMIFTGIGLAWIYERRGNLVASWAAHAAFNAVALVLIYFVR